jgi:hypothetical protein
MQIWVTCFRAEPGIQRKVSSLLQRALAGSLAAALSVGSCSGQAPTTPIPSIDGGAGSCNVLLTVTAGGKPVFTADVKLHIVDGFMGVRRLDLEAYTNEAGQVRFTGLPAKVHRPPLEFRGSKDQLSGVATYDPAAECVAKHDLPLEKQAPVPQ